MSQLPFFSVIIPTFNRADFLRQALDSVFRQEFRDFEVIVVDDGSTEDLSPVINDYLDRVAFLRQDNAGPGAARNCGVARARGEYLAFLDSDDLWFPWTLATYTHVIKNHGNPAFIAGYGVPLCGATVQQSPNSSPIQTTAFPNFLDGSRTESQFRGTPGLAVRTEVVREVGGFIDRFVNGEDQDLCLRLGDKATFVRIDSPAVFQQRTHEGHVSRLGRQSIAGADLILDRERQGQYPGGDTYQAARRGLICALIRNVSLASLDSGNTADAFRLYKRSFWWQLGLKRFKYLLGFPCVAFQRCFERRM